jgi:hypothetical protein
MDFSLFSSKVFVK